MRRAPNLEFAQFDAQGSSAQGDPRKNGLPNWSPLCWELKALQRPLTIDR